MTKTSTKKRAKQQEWEAISSMLRQSLLRLGADPVRVHRESIRQQALNVISAQFPDLRHRLEAEVSRDQVIISVPDSHIAQELQLILGRELQRQLQMKHVRFRALWRRGAA